MAKDVNNHTTHGNKTSNTDLISTASNHTPYTQPNTRTTKNLHSHNNTKNRQSPLFPTHNKHTLTTLEIQEQHENERITRDIFYPFTLEHSAKRNPPDKTFKSLPDYVYKTRPTYIHNKLNLRQIHKLDDEYDSFRRQDKLSQDDKQD